MPHYIWPLSSSPTPDEMNTSFGPRIDMDGWDFHDGVDLPAEEGTAVHAMRAGQVHHAGPGGTGGYSSRHVVVETTAPSGERIYNVYLHLQTIDPAVEIGAHVGQGQTIGTVGKDDATYPHLHFEFRKGTHRQIGSVHPLSYLPRFDTTNFSAPMAERFNRLDGRMAARLLFGGGSKREGDLRRVEVDLRRGTKLLTTRIVDFDDKSTINEEKGDQFRYVDDLCVEGYQKSNMGKDGFTDLKYGILVRKIPPRCDTLVARVIDVGGNVATSAPIAVPNQVAVDEFVDFEDGLPAGWIALTSASGSGTTVAVTASAAHSGTQGLLCVDASNSEATTQRASIEFGLPPNRFEWRVQGWFNPSQLELSAGQAVYVLHVLSSGRLTVAARVRRKGNRLRAGLVAGNPDGDGRDGPVIATGVWRKWRLELLRVGTRETTAVLYLDEGGRMKEQARLNWDTTTLEPTSLRAGIGYSSRRAAATVLVDELWLTEGELAP